MSEENVEVVKSGIEAFNRAGVSGVEGALSDFYDEDIEFREDPKLPEAGTYKGIEAVRGYFARFLDSFEDYRFEIEEILSAEDKVLVFNRQVGRGKGSGAEVEMRNAWLFVLREGRITRIRPYWDRAEALEAAGLAE
jgi:ketosteroid isomerase-like protein